MYVLMNNDIVKSGFYDNSHLLMVVSYGIIRNWGPLGEFFRLLSVSGGTIGNMKQIRPWDQGSSNPDDVDYLLLGAFESGPNAGLDFFYGYYVDVFYGYYDHNLNFLEYNVAFYRDRLNGPYSFSLISAGPR